MVTAQRGMRCKQRHADGPHVTRAGAAATAGGWGRRVACYAFRARCFRCARPCGTVKTCMGFPESRFEVDLCVTLAQG